MTDRDEDIWPLAGEYVLGVLDADERAEVERRRAREPDLEAAIEAWQDRFAPMLDDVDEATPGAEVFERVQRQIDGTGAAPAGRPAPLRAPDPSEAPLAVAGRNETARLRRRLAGWRAAAIAASVVLLGLIGALVYRPDVLVPQQAADQRYVAVFQDDDRAPRFLLSVDLQTRKLTIRPVDAAPAPGQDYQLWIVAEGLGEGPQSLGLLEGTQRPTTRVVDRVTPAALEGALFGISLEPAGGSPTGKPTGPALHGRLIPTGPPSDR